MKIRRLALLSASWLFFACGGGGGGGGSGANDDSPNDTPGSGVSSPSLLLDGAPYAETGKTFQALVVFPDVDSPNPGDPNSLPLTIAASVASYSLVSGPQGLSLDPASGEISWIPSEEQAGEHEISIAVQSGGESFSGTAQILVQGLHLESSGAISAVAGGVVEVFSSASAIYGTRVSVPPGAVSFDQEMTIHSLVKPVVLPEEAIGIELSPSQGFAAPVALEIGYTDSWLASLGVSDESKLAVYYLDLATDSWTKMPGSTVNAAQNKVLVSTTHFSTYALFVTDPGALDPDLGGSMAEAWKLFVGGSNATPPTDGSAYLSMKKDLWQARGFVQVKGMGFRPEQKNALLLHGIYSNDKNFGPLKAWASARYDNVIFYNYPSGMPIRSNATWLAMQMLTNQTTFAPGSCVDVFGHSMGGLVARCAIEDPNTAFVRILTPFVNVTMLGTPNLGGDVSGKWGVFSLHPGLADLLPGSAFLNFLNAEPGQGWAKYYAIAGDEGDGSDGWVSTASAIPSGIFTISQGGVTSPQGHSDIHLDIATNGVGANLASWIQTKTFRQDQIHLVSKQVVVAHHPLGPLDYEYEYESVTCSATFSFDSDFFLPPWIGLTSSWNPVDPYQICYDLDLEKQHVFIDDSFPEINFILQSYPDYFLADDPTHETTIHISQSAGQVTFTRKEYNVPVCPPPGYIPMPGVAVPPPDMELRFYVGGDEEDAIYTLGPF